MCNPRRVRARATRELAEAWDHEIRRLARAGGTAVGRAQVRERLDESLGTPALAALEAALARAPGWVYDEEAAVYRHDLPGGYVAYHLDERELEIVAELSEEVEATGEAAEVARVEMRERFTGEGVGIHYEDGWGGITAADARRQARAGAARDLDERAAARRAEIEAAAEAAQAPAVEHQAQAAADAELARVRRHRGDELRRSAEDNLQTIGIEARNLFHQVLAEAYRDAIVAYAKSRKAEGLVVADRDGVIDIEFELTV